MALAKLTVSSGQESYLFILPTYYLPLWDSGRRVFVNPLDG